MTSVSLIIVNFNAGAERLLHCLDAVKAQTVPPLEVLLVDNGSEDGSFEGAVTAHPDVIAMPMGENLGFAAANNRAAERAQGYWLALLNPDAYPEPDWLEQLLAATERWPQIAFFGSHQLDAADPTKLDGAGDNLHALGIPYRGDYGRDAEAQPACREGLVFAPCAAAALYRRDVFMGLGGFDERFFCYCEDVDLGYRHRLRGGDAVQVPTARVHHEGSGISGRTSHFAIYHGHRNRLWCWAKNTPGLLFWALLPIQLLSNLYFALRFLPTPIGRSYRTALRHGYEAMGQMRQEGQKNGPLWPVMASLTWSPLALSRRRGKVR